MANKNLMLTLVAIFISALLIRASYNITIVGLNTSPLSYVGADDGDYDKLGWNLVKGNGYAITVGKLTAQRASGYPLFLSLVYGIFGHSYAAVRIVQSFLGAISCILIFYIARYIADMKTAYLSAIIYAVYPFALLFTGCILTENLLTFLLLILTLLLFGVTGRTKWGYFLMLGVLVGYLCLIKFQVLLLALFLMLWLFFKLERNFRIFILAAIAFAVGFLIIVAPWTVRNYMVFGRFVPFSTIGGEALLATNNEFILKNPAQYCVSPIAVPGVKEKVNGLNEVERDEVFKNVAIDFFKKNPSKIPVLMFYHIRQLFNPIPHNKVKGALIVIFSYGILLPFMLIGALLSLKNYKRFILLYVLILFVVIVSAVFGGFSRHRQPIEPYLIIFASYAITQLYALFHKTRIHEIARDRRAARDEKD